MSDYSDLLPQPTRTPAPAARSPAVGAGLSVVLVLVAMFAGGLLGVGGTLAVQNVKWSLPATSKVTAAYYVFEKDDGEVPSEVRVALDKLNRERKIMAEPFEQNTVNGYGETPKPYVVPLAEARKAGLPALVVMVGEKAIKVVKKPTTEKQVLEAIP